MVRRIAFGSYLKRNLNVFPGEEFKTPVVELFLKDDERHDPFMIWTQGGMDKGYFALYDANKPISEGIIGTAAVMSPDVANILEDIAFKVFIILEEAWKKQGVTLVDLKIECGTTSEGKIVVADVIDTDSWRLWPSGDKNRMLDKQLYRDAVNMAEVREALKNNYAWVAEATGKFFFS